MFGKSSNRLIRRRMKWDTKTKNKRIIASQKPAIFINSLWKICKIWCNSDWARMTILPSLVLKNYTQRKLISKTKKWICRAYKTLAQCGTKNLWVPHHQRVTLYQSAASSRSSLVAQQIKFQRGWTSALPKVNSRCLVTKSCLQKIAAPNMSRQQPLKWAK